MCAGHSMLWPYGKARQNKGWQFEKFSDCRYNGNAGSPTRRMVENAPSMCAGHDESCPYNGKGAAARTRRVVGKHAKYVCRDTACCAPTESKAKQRLAV